MFITAERPEFNIALKKLDLQTGKERFLDSTKFKDKKLASYSLSVMVGQP